MKITCGVTPHHLMWDQSRMEEPGGLLYKMNPSSENKGWMSSVLGMRSSGRRLTG